MKKIVCAPLSVVSFLLLLVLLSPIVANGQDDGWRVWIKISPCSGRLDWVSVAKTNPEGGLNYYYLANQLFPSAECTRQGCTFAGANAVAASLRTSSEFFKYCCRDYSVWQNTQTGQMTVVVGKFGTAGLGWRIVKGDLCCEEAEALSGISGACSGNTATQQLVQNTKCWPGSFAAWNAQAQRVECYCNPGLVWNNTKTACISPQVQNVDCSGYPGSYAVWNEQTKRAECWCPEGKTWNSTRTACVDVVAQINCWPGSYAAVNPQTGKTECYCNPGLVWNSTKTACVTPQTQNTDCSGYPGSYAAWNTQTQRMECWCPEGKTWNSTKTACVDVISQVNCWPGSYAAVNPQTGKTECYCNPGLVWNSTKTACVTPGSNNGSGTTWTLVSVTSSPATPGQGWSFNSSGTAHLDVYSGDKADFRWTPPPTQFNNNGFTVSLSVTGIPAPNSRIAALIDVAGYGLDSDTPTDQRSAYATPPSGPASAQRSVTFRPSSSASEIEVKIVLMWGGVTFRYKYQRSQ